MSQRKNLIVKETLTYDSVFETWIPAARVLLLLVIFIMKRLNAVFWSHPKIYTYACSQTED